MVKIIKIEIVCFTFICDLCGDVQGTVTAGIFFCYLLNNTPNIIYTYPYFIIKIVMYMIVLFVFVTLIICGRKQCLILHS